MSTFKEIIYMCSDLLKISSDDAFYTNDHIMYLASKYRGLLLEQKYKNSVEEIPSVNYQTICLDLQQSNTLNNSCGETLLKSTIEIPSRMSVGCFKIYPPDFFAGEVTFVSRERLKYVGNNEWLQNIIYAAIAPDNHLYLKSSNPQFLHLEKVKANGIFEDADKANDLSCTSSSDTKICDKIDNEFPLEETLVPVLIESVTKFISSGLYKPQDPDNNAADDLSNITTFIRQNMKSALQKQIE